MDDWVGSRRLAFTFFFFFLMFYKNKWSRGRAAHIVHLKVKVQTTPTNTPPPHTHPFAAIVMWNFAISSNPLRAKGKECCTLLPPLPLKTESGEHFSIRSFYFYIYLFPGTIFYMCLYISSYTHLWVFRWWQQGVDVHTQTCVYIGKWTMQYRPKASYRQIVNSLHSLTP